MHVVKPVSPDETGRVDVLVVSRSATVRRCFASACESRGLRSRGARDVFDAIAMLGLGMSLRQVVFIGPQGTSDARAVQRRLQAAGVREVPLLTVTDTPTGDLPAVPVGHIEGLLSDIVAQLPSEGVSIPSWDDEEQQRQMEARRELNKAQALFLDVVSRVDNHDLPGPMMPQLLVRLRRKLQDPRLSLYDLAEFVKPHQALSARVMALANSAHYSRGVPVTSLRQALPRIGLERAGALMQAVATLEYEVGSDARTRALIRRFLKESYLSALVAEQLAEACLHPEPAEVYTAGLFHNIGSTFLVYTFALLFERGAAKAIAPDALEATALANRGQLNRLLGKALELPEALQHLDEAAASAPFATERLVVQAAWVAEHALANSMDPVELDADARMLGVDQNAIEMVNRALPKITESLLAFS